MSERHRPVRPGWTCADDGLPWPCLPARQAMLRRAGEDMTGLQRRLVVLVMAAEGELVRDEVTVAVLYRRFVGWALAPGECCRMCGSRRHAVLPGVPPRIVPCNKVRMAVRDGLASVGPVPAVGGHFAGPVVDAKSSG